MKKILLITILMLCCSGMALAEPRFAVELESAYGTSLLDGAWRAGQGHEVSIKTLISNAGTSGSMKVEVGIYKKSTIEDWYGSTFNIFPSDENIMNCPGSGDNVQTKEFPLSSGESEIVYFKVIAPSNPDIDYVIHLNAFQRCYVDSPGDTGQTDYAVHEFDVRDTGDAIVETCNDGLVNQDETDTDCGGVTCNSCPDYYECRFDRDCKDQSFCVDNGASGETICYPETATEDKTPEGTADETTTEEELLDGDRPPNDEPDRTPGIENTIVEAKKESEWRTIPIIIGERSVDNGAPIRIRAQFYAEETGDYLLEGAIGKIGDLFAVELIDVNTCDPGETEFSNKLVHLTQGINEIEFDVGSRKDGDNRFWVAYVEKCGGDVWHQVLGDGLVRVGSLGDGVGEGSLAPSASNLWLIIGGIILVLVFGGLWYWALKK